MALVPYTNIEDGADAGANDINGRFGDVLGQVNGNLDASNIRKGSLTRELFAADAFQAMWPVNSVYISVENVNPSSKLGGTWVAFASGRTLVGVDTAQTEFNTVEKPGGHKLLQEHNHAHRQWTFNGSSTGGGNHYGIGYQPNTGNPFDAPAYSNTGEVQFGNFPAGGGDSQNLQPYITVYFWKRVL